MSEPPFLPAPGNSHETVHLGVVAYVWGALHQDRLLLECLSPAVADLRRQGLVRRFWFDRHDARGPHIFALLSLARERAPEIAEQLAVRLREHLAAHPSATTLTPEQLARRHKEIRERWQCEADGRSGFAINNSFETFEHPAHGYPFRLSEGLPGEEGLWDCVSDLSLWTIGQLATRPGAPAMSMALRWASSVHRELRLAGAEPADYWRYDATALLPGLFTGMGPEEKAATLAELAGGVGTGNTSFVQAWQEVADADPVWPELPGLIHLILGGSSDPSPWRLLREIHHTVLKQLGVPSAFHLPIALRGVALAQSK